MRYDVQGTARDRRHETTSRGHSSGRHHRAGNGARYSRAGPGDDDDRGFTRRLLASAARPSTDHRSRHTPLAGRPLRGPGVGWMDDKTIQAHIEELVNEEHQLLEHGDI